MLRILIVSDLEITWFKQNSLIPDLQFKMRWQNLLPNKVVFSMEIWLRKVYNTIVDIADLYASAFLQ